MTCSSCANPNGYGIHVREGESKTFQFTVRDSTKALVDLTLASIYFSVKKRYEDTIYVFQRKSVQAGGSIAQVLIPDQTIAANKGIFFVYLVPSNTQTLYDEDTDYLYDVWVTPANGLTYCIIPPSTFEVDPAVTVIQQGM